MVKYCQGCGAELSDEASFCFQCGMNVSRAQETDANENTKKKFKPAKVWVISAVAVLILGILAMVLFSPRDLRIEDFGKMSVVSAVLKYGMPEKFDTNEYGDTVLVYNEKVDFYGMTPRGCNICPEKGTVFLAFREQESDDVYDRISHYCEFKRDAAGIYHHFSYGDLEITIPAYDGYYVLIETY